MTDHIHVQGSGCELYAEFRRTGISIATGTDGQTTAAPEIIIPASEAKRLGEWLLKAAQRFEP